MYVCAAEFVLLCQRGNDAMIDLAANYTNGLVFEIGKIVDAAAGRHDDQYDPVRNKSDCPR